MKATKQATLQRSIEYVHCCSLRKSAEHVNKNSIFTTKLFRCWELRRTYCFLSEIADFSSIGTAGQHPTLRITPRERRHSDLVCLVESLFWNIHFVQAILYRSLRKTREQALFHKQTSNSISQNLSSCHTSSLKLMHPRWCYFGLSTTRVVDFCVNTNTNW